MTLFAVEPYTNQAIIEAEQAHTSGVYPKRGVALVRGAGARVWDADGVEYLDCTAAQGAANLGHLGAWKHCSLEPVRVGTQRCR